MELGLEMEEEKAMDMKLKNQKIVKDMKFIRDNGIEICFMEKDLYMFKLTKMKVGFTANTKMELSLKVKLILRQMEQFMMVVLLMDNIKHKSKIKSVIRQIFKDQSSLSNILVDME